MSFSIRLNDEEKMLADSYAKLHGMALGEAFKTALFEKIEDEYDIARADSIHQEMIDTNEKPQPIEKLWEELGI